MFQDKDEITFVFNTYCVIYFNKFIFHFSIIFCKILIQVIVLSVLPSNVQMF